jgi:hypothetical protein
MTAAAPMADANVIHMGDEKVNGKESDIYKLVFESSALVCPLHSAGESV